MSSSEQREPEQQGLSPALLRELAETSGDGIYTRTLDGIVTSWSRGAERISGYPAEEIVGRPVTVFSPLDAVRSAAENVLRGQPFLLSDVECVRKDGRHITVSTSIAPLRDAHGQIVGISGIMRDVTARVEAEEALRMAEQRYRAFFQASPIGIELVNQDGVLTETNTAFQEMLGYSAEELRGLHWTAITHAEDIEAEAALDREMDTGTRSRYELVKRFVRKDGTVIWTRLSSSDVGRIAAGDFQFTIGMVEDITEQIEAREALRESEERYRSVVEATPDGIAIVDFEGIVQFANGQFARMLGFASPEDVVGKPGLEFVLPEDREIVETELGSIAQRGHLGGVRCRQRRVDGSVFLAQLSGGLIRNESGAPAGIAAVMSDLSEQAANEEQLRHLALHDALTNVPNRTLLMDRLTVALAASQRHSGSLALLLIDLDDFKEVNDTYGHQIGDQVLAEIARRLQAALEPSDTIARFGGDEFAIVLPGVDLLGALQVVSTVVSVLEQSIVLNDHRLQVGASIGVALAPEHGTTPDEMLSHSDIAMHAAQRTNSGHAVYSPDQDSFSPHRLALVNELRHAIESNQLVLHFQPKLNLRTGQIEHAEALVRWQHPVHGLIPPDQFISTAEQSGLIRPLTGWVVRQALAQCRSWRDLNLDIGVCVNLSARSLHDPRLPETLRESLRDAQVPANRLTLEITESTIMAEPERAMEVLRSIEGLGISVAIDDFGTGYSSLGYLRELGASELKIDKSFVFSLARDNPEGFIVKSVIDLGHKLGMEVVAEGVETEPVLETLRTLECDWAQGYQLSRPQPAEALTSWLSDRPDVRRQGRQIVLVDDDPDLRDMLTDLLADAGYSVLPIAGPAEAREIPGTLAPALFLVDIMLTGMSGIDLAEALRQREYRAPMVGMTASRTLHTLAEESGLFTRVLHKPFEEDALLGTVSQVLQEA